MPGLLRKVHENRQTSLHDHPFQRRIVIDDDQEDDDFSEHSELDQEEPVDNEELSRLLDRILYGQRQIPSNHGVDQGMDQPMAHRIDYTGLQSPIQYPSGIRTQSRDPFYAVEVNHGENHSVHHSVHHSVYHSVNHSVNFPTDHNVLDMHELQALSHSTSSNDID